MLLDNSRARAVVRRFYQRAARHDS